MEAVPEGMRPHPVAAEGPPAVAGEAAELARLARAGVALAPAVWVPAVAEEGFYRFNGLPARLAELFAPVSERDPDEDDVEDLVPAARELVARHALLDAWIDAFYDATAFLPGRVRVRRPGTAGRVATRGRPALLALRTIWAEDWTFDAVLERLRATGSVALEARPVLVHDAEEAPAPPGVAARVREVLGEDRDARVDGEGRVTRTAS